MAKRRETDLPDWAAQERTGDLAWIQAYAHTFWSMAYSGYRESGRGAVVVDTTSIVPHPGGTGHLVGYFDQAAIREELGDEETLRLIRDYQPEEQEFVTTLLKAQDRVSSYRLQFVGQPREPASQRVEVEATSDTSETRQPGDSGSLAQSLNDEQILTAIACWLANTTEPITWWDWDGETLTIDTGQEIERYDRDTVLAVISSNPSDETDDQDPRQSGEGERLMPPDLETLMAWADEGICEAACPEHCVVEPDGICSHGHPSWLLKLGLI